jgi:hypothetical protein
MDKDDLRSLDVLRRLESADAKLARHEHLTGIVLFFLTLAATLALGLLVGHIAGVPWLSHP